MKKTESARPRRRTDLLTNILCALLVFLGFLCIFSAWWYSQVYGDTSFASIIYTLTVNLGGVQSSLVSAFLRGAVLPTVIGTAAVCVVLFWQPPRRLVMTLWNRVRIRLYPLGRWLRSLCALLLCGLLVVYAALTVGLPQYVADQLDQSALYDTVYVDPAGADIRFPTEKKNLIYILLESMETTFFSQAEGGSLPGGPAEGIPMQDGYDGYGQDDSVQNSGQAETSAQDEYDGGAGQADAAAEDMSAAADASAETGSVQDDPYGGTSYEKEETTSPELLFGEDISSENV
jgi:hypothetical protein